MEIDYDEIPVKLRMAYRVAAESSTDKSTKLGAVICQEHWNVCVGCNCHIDGYGDKPEHHERPLKYAVTEHAERNALFRAHRQGHCVQGLTLVCPWVACADCARAIALMGIKDVVCHTECMDRTPERWRESVDFGLELLDTLGVNVVQWSGKIGGVENLNNGEVWLP